MLRRLPIFALLSCSVVAARCTSAPTAPLAPVTTPSPAPTPAPPAPDQTVWDITKNGVPRFVTHQYIDLSSIREISRFRSAEGHSYADEFEACRSMKHYFRTPTTSSARSIPIYAPVTGEVVSSYAEWAGLQVAIRPTAYPAFRIVIFHVNPVVNLDEGAHLDAGTLIGTHIGEQTMSDVAVSVGTPQGYQLVSWFEVLTDSLFDEYRTRGLQSRDEAIISRNERDANPLTCNGETFIDRGSLSGWIRLQ